MHTCGVGVHVAAHARHGGGRALLVRHAAHVLLCAVVGHALPCAAHAVHATCTHSVHIQDTARTQDEYYNQLHYVTICVMIDIMPRKQYCRAHRLLVLHIQLIM